MGRIRRIRRKRRRTGSLSQYMAGLIRREYILEYLTWEQQDRLFGLSDEWVNNAFRKKDFDKPLIEDSVRWLYRMCGLSSPEIHYADSPLGCQTLSLQFKEGKKTGWKNIYSAVRENIESRIYHLVPDSVHGRVKRQVWNRARQATRVKLKIETDLRNKLTSPIELFSSNSMRDVQWGCYYEYFDELGIANCRELARYSNFVFNSGVFMGVYDASRVIVCPNPSYVGLNRNFDLHCPDGPALSWDDGYKLYILDGTPVSEVYFIPASELDPILLLKERNAEARCEIIRKIGIGKVMGVLGARLIDKWGGYELLRLDIPGMKIEPTYLKMQNPSTGTWHIEGVPPEIRTCREALNWRVGGLEEWRPEQLT